MRNGKKILTMVASAALAVSTFGGCGAGAGGAKEGVLTIRYFEGGYGREWIENAAEEFKAYKKEKDGVEIETSLTADPSITTTAYQTLKSNNNVPDLMLTQGGSWIEWVTAGYLESLKDVYDAKVNTSGGEVTVREFMKEEIADGAQLQRLYGQGEWQEWVMPWASLECALAYNEDYLLTVNASKNYEGRTSGGKWIAFPETVEELKTYFNDVIAMGDGVAPIVWGGADGTNWFDYPILVWWAQQQGYESVNTKSGISESEGSFRSFFNYESAEVWKQTGIQKAMDTVREVFVDTEGQKWKNTSANVKELTIQNAEAEFIKGNAAVMLAGSFLENEMKQFNSKNYTIKMATFPLTENCETDENGKGIKYHYVSEGDMMFVPAKATNKTLAKEFLAFIASEEQVLKFTKYTGCMRPFKYDPLALAPDHAWTAYQRSGFEIMKNCVALSTLPTLSRQERPAYLVYGGLNWRASTNTDTITAKLLRLTGKEVMVTGDAGFRSIYESGKVMLDDAKKTFED